MGRKIDRDRYIRRQTLLVTKTSTEITITTTTTTEITIIILKFWKKIYYYAKISKQIVQIVTEI